MKTTVKDFILDNMTDSNFEKLVKMLLIESVNIYGNEMTDTIIEYVNAQKSSYSNIHSFDILNHIKKIPDTYTYYYNLDTDEEVGIFHLNDSSAFEQVKANRLKKVSGDLEIEMNKTSAIMESPKAPIKDRSSMHVELKNNSTDEDYFPLDTDLEMNDESEDDFYDFQNINFAFISTTEQNNEGEIIAYHDVNMTNYEEYVYQEKKRIARDLSNFIYEILQYNSEYKLQNDFESFTHEKSLVKVEKENESGSDYDVHILLDNRTRYISKEIRREYAKRMQDFDLEQGYRSSNLEIKEIEPRFVEYDVLQEDLANYENEYMIEPFIYYLNEAMTIPEVSEEGLYNILEQFIHLLTHQGFTVEKQIEEIRSFDKDYDNKWG